MSLPADQEAVWAGREIVDRLNDAGTGDRYERWVNRARGCRQPVRLVGVSREADAASGEVVREFTSAGEPDGVVLKPCGNRRSQVCAPCADVYRGDAWQLVAAGMRGGKGVPETVAEHPVAFATFTAPSFGPVHTVREAGGKRLACRPRRAGETCAHGRSLACSRRHRDDDPWLGEAICPDCFDYERAVLWNQNAGRLFRRTRTYVERELAREAGVTQKVARGQVRVSYVKVAEFQRRGVVHFHILWRLDAAGEELVAPPQPYDAQLLAEAIAAALPKSTVPAETPDAEPYAWGRQHEVRPLDLGADAAEAGRVAAYIAKYATKSTEAVGGVMSKIKSERELRRLRCRDHARRHIEAAWTLGARVELDGKRLRRWAHQLGYGGHCFTKSRRYSTTFKALRGARAQHAAAAYSAVAGDVAAKTDHNLIRHKAWRYGGRGYPKAGDALLALSSAARTRERRLAARVEVDMERGTRGTA
jgi:hypothetical protein